MVKASRGREITRYVGKDVDATKFRPRLDEADIATMGPNAIGNYGEIVTKNFLRSHGVRALSEYPYKDAMGRPHLADFYDVTTGIAFEVKTGVFKSSAIQDFKIEPLQYAITSKQFGRVIFVNVKFLGRVGFAESIRRCLRRFGTITLC